MRIRCLLGMTILAALMLSGPALAVKKVAKSENTSSEKQQDNERKQPVSPANNPQQPAPDRSREDRNKNEKPVESEKPVVKEKDRFVDEDGDGLNDKIKKPPETVKKKRESKPEGSEKR